jgi:dipeptidase
MKKTLFIALFAACTSMGWACTNFLVGKDATIDGSTMVTYSADSYSLFGALYHYPAATHAEGAMRPVYDWDTGKYLGEIPEAAQTYNVVGNMNEHQLTIGETTYGGREELVDTTGLIDYGSLIYITLQRAKNAREAIHTMTDLVAQYGYCSSGESFSVADPQEVWILEMIGKGVGNKGAVWVARRIPDDCISAHANQARITTFPLEGKKSPNSLSSKHIDRLQEPQIDVVYSDDVISFARKKGYFKGKDEEFSFSDTYNPLDYGGIRWCEARVWAFFNALNDSMAQYLDYINGESLRRMPLWVKPNQKITLETMRGRMRDHYEGTPLDMTMGAGSGPYATPFRPSPLTYEVDSVEYYHERPVATQQTGFTFVAQMRSWLPDAIGGILWFGVDDATGNLYVPMYCCLTKVPISFSEKNGSLLDFSWTSAFWVNNWVCNMAYTRYSDMIPEIKAEQKKWESYFETAAKQADSFAQSYDSTSMVQFLTDFSNAQAETAITAWKKLGERLMVKYLDGVTKPETNGVFDRDDYNNPKKIIRPGYNEDFNREEFVKPDPERFRVKSKDELGTK